MSFNVGNFRSVTKHTFTYHTTDSLATILAPAYFVNTPTNTEFSQSLNLSPSDTIDVFVWDTVIGEGTLLAHAHLACLVIDTFKAVAITSDILPVSYAQLSSSVDQVPINTDPTVITFDTQNAISGVTHSTSVNSGEIIIDISGVYIIFPQPQVGKDSGGQSTAFGMFMQKDTGNGFEDVVDTNVKLVVKSSELTDVIILSVVIPLNAGDKIRFMQKVSSTTGGLGLKVTPEEIGPPTIPSTPSIIFTMHRLGPS